MKKLKDILGKALFILVVADGTYHLAYTVLDYWFGFCNGLIEKKKNKEEKSETKSKFEGEA